MGYVLILLGFLGFFAAIIYMIIKAIKRRFSKKLFFLPLACIVLLFAGAAIVPTPAPQIPESIVLTISDYQDEYDVNTEIPIDVSIQPEDAKTDNLKYITTEDAITFSESGIVTGSKEGTYDIYIESGDIKSNTLTITVIDMEARKIAQKEAEEKRLAKEAALKEAEEKRLAEEAEAKRKAEEAQVQAEAQQKAEEARKQTEAEKANTAAQETTKMYAANTLNIRSANNTNSEILGKFSVNDTVDVISTDGDWATILYDDNIAYVASTYLSSSKTVAPAQTETQTDEVGEQVWIPQTGSKYHRRSTCSGMKNPTQVSRSRAESLGYEPCKKCY